MFVGLHCHGPYSAQDLVDKHRGLERLVARFRPGLPPETDKDHIARDRERNRQRIGDKDEHQDREKDDRILRRVKHSGNIGDRTDVGLKREPLDLQLLDSRVDCRQPVPDLSLFIAELAGETDLVRHGLRRENGNLGIDVLHTGFLRSIFILQVLKLKIDKVKLLGCLLIALAQKAEDADGGDEQT